MITWMEAARVDQVLIGLGTAAVSPRAVCLPPSLPLSLSTPFPGGALASYAQSSAGQASRDHCLPLPAGDQKLSTRQNQQAVLQIRFGVKQTRHSLSEWQQRVMSHTTLLHRAR